MSRKKVFPYAERAQAVEEARKNRWIDRFWAALNLALPPDFWPQYNDLKAGDADSIDPMIDFLEADPMFFRSGYIKADVLRWINRLPLTTTQMRRLQAVVVGVTERRGGREFRRYCNLARRLEDTEFRLQIERLRGHADAAVRRRANWVVGRMSD
ncbi:MAG TPA: hypothetical protein VKU90_16740 [Caulobacteraceae bacterium]|nr:hypothetical protein [Caulobacteraceae bacterium]